MKLNRELSQRAGWKLCVLRRTIVLDAAYIIGIVRFNSHERSELTSIFTPSLTSFLNFHFYSLFLLPKLQLNYV